MHVSTRAFLIVVFTRKETSDLRDDAELGSTDELDDVADGRAVGHLFLNLVHCVEDGDTAVEHQSVGVGDVLKRLFVNAVGAADGGIDATILSTLGADDVGRNVAREGGAGLYHSTTADAGLGVLDDGTGEDDAVLDEAVAGNLRTVADDATVADLRVMRDVGTLHKHVLVTDDGLASRVCGAVDDDVLADDVTVADDALRLLAAELEVLWQGTNDGALMDFIALTHARTTTDADEGEDNAAITYHHVVLDIYEGEYLTVVADLSLRTDFGLWGYFACHFLNS